MALRTGPGSPRSSSSGTGKRIKGRGKSRIWAGPPALKGCQSPLYVRNLWTITMASTPPQEGLPDDPFAGERFIRVVGRRRRPEVGELPTAEARAAMTSLLARHRT